MGFGGATFAFADSLDEVLVSLFLTGQRTLPVQMSFGICKQRNPKIMVAATLLLIVVDNVVCHSGLPAARLKSRALISWTRWTVMDPLWPLYLDEWEGDPPVGKRSEGWLTRLFRRMNRARLPGKLSAERTTPSGIRFPPESGSIICVSNENITSINYGNLFLFHMLVPPSFHRRDR